MKAGTIVLRRDSRNHGGRFALAISHGDVVRGAIVLHDVWIVERQVGSVLLKITEMMAA